MHAIKTGEKKEALNLKESVWESKWEGFKEGKGRSSN